MADQQPGDEPAAAGDPEGSAIEGAGATAPAPARWSGSAAVPPPAPKKSRRAARLGRPDDPAPASAPASPPREPDPTPVDPLNWASMPAVDPWADQEGSWDALTSAPEPPMPPTRVDRPAATRIDGPPVPTPASPPPANPPRQSVPPQSVPPQSLAPQSLPVAAARPAPPPPPSRGRWGRKPKQPVNRLPVQPRPPTPPPAAPNSPGRGLPPPPPWAERPAPRPLPPPRKRRRRGRRFGLFLLLGVLCCCGGPLAYYNVPAARQYPVTAVLPQSFLDLDRRDDDASKAAAARLAQEAGEKAGSFAGVYGDGDGKRVTIFGVTGWRLDPGKDVRTELDRLSDDFDLNDVQSFPAGEAGVYERCGVGRSNGKAVVVCAWADHGSLATVLLTRRSLDESAGLVEQLRGAVLTPGITGKTSGIPLL
jgi:hypothetical protein